MTKKMRSRFGFTVVELLVIMAIFMAVTFVFIPTLSTAREKAKRVKDANNLKQMGVMLMVFFDEFKRQPHEKYSDAGDGTLMKQTQASNVAVGRNFVANLYVDDEMGWLGKEIFKSPLAQVHETCKCNDSKKKKWGTATVDVSYCGWNHWKAFMSGEKDCPKANLQMQNSKRGIISSLDDGKGDLEGINILFGDGHVDFLKFADRDWHCVNPDNMAKIGGEKSLSDAGEDAKNPVDIKKKYWTSKNSKGASTYECCLLDESFE